MKLFEWLLELRFRWRMWWHWRGFYRELNKIKREVEKLENEAFRH